MKVGQKSTWAGGNHAGCLLFTDVAPRSSLSRLAVVYVAVARAIGGRGGSKDHVAWIDADGNKLVLNKFSTQHTLTALKTPHQLGRLTLAHLRAKVAI